MNKLSIIGLGLVILCMCVGAWFVFSTTDTKSDTPVELIDTQAAAITIIAFGDSLTAGYGVQLREAYPAQLERALRTQGYDVEVINSGVSGETTRGNKERASFIRSQNPDVVILGTGGNDALRSLPVENTQNNIADTVDVLLAGESAPEVLLLKMQAPLNSGQAYKQDFDAIYETVASQENIPLVPFLTEDIFFAEGNKLPDGIHYNAQGYAAVIEAHLLPAVRDVLQENR